MRKWEHVGIREKLKATKKRIGEKIKNTKETVKNKQKPFMLSLALMLGGLSSQGQNIFGGKEEFNDKLDNMYAGVMQNNPGMNVQSIEEYLASDFVLEPLTFEDAARDRTAYVFMHVVSNMNEIAQEGLKVWKNPTKKAQFVKNIFQTAVGYKSTQASCLASCSASLVEAFISLDDDPSFLPKGGRTYGNSLIAQKELKDYIVSVKPGTGAIEKAIEENNVQPGDFILIPRNSKNYHSVMYVGKNDDGEHIYSACNNPAYKKTFGYYNKQAMKYGRDTKIIKMNQKYYDEFLAEMNRIEKEGVAKEVIIAFVYDTMGEGELIFSNLKEQIDKLEKINNVNPVPQQENKNKKEEGKKIIAQRIFKNARISRG